MKKKAAPWIFLFPSLLGISIFVLVPFLDVIRRSFLDAMGNVFIGFFNYKTVLANEAFGMAVKNTGRFILLCIPLLLITSLAAALMLYRRKTLKSFLKSSLLLPMAVPVASVALVWRVLFHRKGLVNAVLASFITDYQAVDFLNSSSAFYVLLLSYLWKNIGYDMILWLSGLAGIPESHYEAAAVDGAGAAARFFYITLPQLLPSASMIIILSLINTFKVFREAYLIGGDYPDDSMYMMQHIFNNWFTSLDVQKMSAGAVLMAAVVFSLSAVLRRVGEKQ